MTEKKENEKQSIKTEPNTIFSYSILSQNPSHIWSQLRKCYILGLFWFGFPLSLKQMSDKVRISLK